jgi:hypothetical protein
MTLGQLYREVWLELHPGKYSEGIFKMADTFAPSGINQEVPPERVEALRKKFLEIGRRIDALSDEEVDKICQDHTGKN